MATTDFQPGTPLADALQNAIQPKLAENGWSSGAGEDSALAEFIILMLSNGKDQAQIASELATDLLGLEPNDAGAIEFVRWLFEQASVIHAQQNGAPVQQSSQQVPPANGTTQTVVDATGQDATMSGAIDTAGAGAVPTGPKSMRSGSGAGAQRGRDRRMAGQMRSALDRGGDAGIHRIKGAASRINSHERGPPAGPRGMASKMQNMMAGGARNGQPMNAQMMQNMASSVHPQQQMQLFKMLEEQSRMMAQLLGPGGQQAAVNPKFFNNGGRGRGKSLFERVDRGRQNGHRQQRYEGAADGDDMAMGDDASKKPAAEVPCKFQLQCTSSTCPYAHQSPAAAPGISIDVADTCSFGAACTNKKCVASHPSPAQKRQYLTSTVDCKFFPNCTNPSCPFRHPSTPPCRNGADCPQKDTGCRFSHSTIQCRYNPCLNPHCVFKHEEGQKQSNQWKGEHVSERKFDTSNGQEELILPGQMEEDGGQKQDGGGEGMETTMEQAEDVVA
ncbi:U3 small nucleolar RNA-associated protein 20 [Sphaceloma murrayae]|uniref:U3 small nucleolar RNA-associated protein 20 n=1 Tax=Sphaceloma murrayae TaxID=2082308 RepID=A0A2K1R079_9PEZI|nr:U3 small nucleolar RNA-associated protein 20 [Sphaceloma murrayae]